MKRILLCLCLSASFIIPATAQKCDLDDFASICPALDSLVYARTNVHARLKFRKVVRKGKALDIYFGQTLSDLPLRKEDVQWLRQAIESLLPTPYAGRKVGRMFAVGNDISSLVVDAPTNDGKCSSTKLRVKVPTAPALVQRGIQAPRGLGGRHIAMWQSHGYYYNIKSGSWKWQRPFMFQTVEDLFTQSYVVPLLAPMLENAGANVLLPRERDFHTEEIIIDNDPSEKTSSRIHGYVEMSGTWKNIFPGFADTKEFYNDADRPFTSGSAMQSSCDQIGNSSVSWSADIPSKGEYAVYVTYRSVPSSSTRAKYTVHTLGCDKVLRVNQKMGSGTWVYLGTFEFGKGLRKLLTLESEGSPKGSVIVADAVKIGGGMGNIERKPADSTCVATTSRMPRFAEGARYFMQWSGIPEKVWSQNEGADDYRDDLMSRGAWVGYLAGGSVANPKKEGLGIPIDMSLAFHTDAGYRKDSSIVGTLSIYTLKCDKSTKLPGNRKSRATCRELADFVQTQVTGDIMAQWNPNWSRRMLWNRSYSESRTTSTPAVLLELLSHMNFEDMKYGQDPAFRWSVARSCYKAILKYLSMRYAVPYTVQPLPVKDFSVAFDSILDKECSVTLKWRERVDSLEPTATPTLYYVHTRIDGGGWDEGRQAIAEKNPQGYCTFTTAIRRGSIYSFKVVAANDGGLSFPSEILSTGVPEGESKGKVAIINGFTRISGPTWFDSEMYAGFDNLTDSGVPYIRDWHFTGQQVQLCRAASSGKDESKCFGACKSDYVDKVIAGNTFDYPYVHAMSLLGCGYAVYSMGEDAFAADASLCGDASALDIIYGKQCTVMTGCASAPRFVVLSAPVRKAIKYCTDKGCNVIISGAHIATDLSSSIYPIYDWISADLRPAFTAERRSAAVFADKVLGYSLHSGHASQSGQVSAIDGSIPSISYPTAPCIESYCVESPDALHSFGLGREIFMMYGDTGLPAAVRSDFSTYKVAAFGFPLEILSDSAGRDSIFKSTMEYFQRDARGLH